MAQSRRGVVGSGGDDGNNSSEQGSSHDNTSPPVVSQVEMMKIMGGIQTAIIWMMKQGKFW